jgi:hypothetical protein
MTFRFRLETADGRPAEPAEMTSAVPNMRSGYTIPLGQRTPRVVDNRDDDPTSRRCSLLRTRPRPGCFPVANGAPRRRSPRAASAGDPTPSRTVHARVSARASRLSMGFSPHLAIVSRPGGHVSECERVHTKRPRAVGLGGVTLRLSRAAREHSSEVRASRSLAAASPSAFVAARRCSPSATSSAACTDDRRGPASPRGAP